MFALALVLAQVEAADTADLIDPDSPAFQAKVAACLRQLGDEPEDAAMWTCLGLKERFEICTAQEQASDQLIAFDQCMGLKTPETMSLADLREGIAARHPFEMLTLARRTFDEAEDKAGGLFWFYASQLRWRTRLSCRDFEPGGEGALYGAMFETLGPMFNEWAGENINVWLATIDKVHDWDIATKERFAEDADCLAQAKEQRAGMLALKQSLIDNRAEIEAKAAERREARAKAAL
ncbi:MAG: hypothetical protein AAF291_05725 [Pseudomonadota bacterium]